MMSQAATRIDPSVLTGVFALKAGETAVVHARDGGPWVATIDKIEPITPEISQMLRAQLQGEMTRSITQDLNETFVLGLRSEVEFKRDEAAVEKYVQSMIGDKAQP